MEDKHSWQSLSKPLANQCMHPHPALGIVADFLPSPHSLRCCDPRDFSFFERTSLSQVFLRDVHVLFLHVEGCVICDSIGVSTFLWFVDIPLSFSNTDKSDCHPVSLSHSSSCCFFRSPFDPQNCCLICLAAWTAGPCSYFVA